MEKQTFRGLKLFGVSFLTLLIALLASAPVASQRPVTAKAEPIDEIVVVGTDGYVYAYNYLGEQIFKSPEGGWSYVATGDLNNDGDQEIIAVSGSRVKAYDPQIIGTEFAFDTTFAGSGTFTKVDVGYLAGNDNVLDIALIRSLGGTVSRIVIYEPPNTNPIVNAQFDLTDWGDFAIGDYDGDGDDDFALIYWNNSYMSGFKNWFELRKGHDPLKKLQDSNDAGDYSDSQWFDIVSGEFFADGNGASEWAGSQNLDRPITVQKWDRNDKEIDNVWSMGTAFNFLTAADFRDDGDVDQLGMLRNTSSGVSLQFSRNGFVWASLSGLGTGWLNMASGNLDVENNPNGKEYKEAVILRTDLIRIFLKPHAGGDGTSEFLTCNTPGNCLDISGSFNGSLAVGDLGEDFTVIPPPKPIVPYTVTPAIIVRTPGVSETIQNGTFTISGDQNNGDPINWGAVVLPAFDAEKLQQLTAQNQDLSLSISGKTLQYETATQNGTLPLVNWMTLDKYSGVATTTVTASFSDTFPGSPLYNIGAYKAIIFVWRDDVREDRFRYVDVTVLRPSDFVYLPLAVK